MVCSQPIQCLESGFISPNSERRDLSGSVKLFEIKETSFQKSTCSIWFSSKISGISIKWKAPTKSPIIYKACHAVAFHFATGHSGTANWVFCSNGKRLRRRYLFSKCVYQKRLLPGTFERAQTQLRKQVQLSRKQYNGYQRYQAGKVSWTYTVVWRFWKRETRN